MRYMGSKNRISKELKVIIESYINENTEGYLEPFVGGANIIDKINCKNKIGSDIHKQLIALLNYVKDENNYLPEIITEEEYYRVKNNQNEYEDWYIGLVGFCGSFGSRYFGGYARHSKGDNSGKWSAGAIRTIEKQRTNLKDITFIHRSFLDIKENDYKNYVIYCDIPYRNTTKYSKTELFPYDEFYKWCKVMAKNNTVLVSEYSMPDDFECIWEKDVKCHIDSKRINGTTKTEKLFIVKP